MPPARPRGPATMPSASSTGNDIEPVSKVNAIAILRPAAIYRFGATGPECADQPVGGPADRSLQRELEPALVRAPTRPGYPARSRTGTAARPGRAQTEISPVPDHHAAGGRRAGHRASR